MHLAARWPLAALVLLFLDCPLAWAYDAAQKIESARLYGNIGGFAYYYVDLLVGTPTPQRTSLIVDTGSAVCAFSCKGCSHCGKHLDANFDISRSATAKWIACGAKFHCSLCNKGRCSYSQSYTEGSSISGSWFSDYISLGDEFQHNPPVVGRLGCHSRETRLFYTQQANGIFGMAPGRSGKATILDDLFQDKQHINTAVFAMCLSEEGGLLTVGGYNASLHASQGLVWVPMVANHYYAVDLRELTVEGTSLAITSGFGKTIVDSGTTHTYLPHAIYRQLDAEVGKFCQRNNNCGGTPKGITCWVLPPKPTEEAVEGFPAIRWGFASGGKMLWRPQSYMYRRDGKGNTWCYGFQSNGQVAETVLGATFMLHRDIVFDVAGGRLGLAEAACPTFKKRPPPPSERMAVVIKRPPVQGGPAPGPESVSLPPLPPEELGSRPGLFVAALVLVSGGGLFAIAWHLHLAGTRAEQPVQPRMLASVRQVKRKVQPGSSPSAIQPVVLGRSSSSGQAPGDRDQSLTSTPLELWLHPGDAAASGSGGGTPGSACEKESSSGTDRERQRILGRGKRH